MAGDDYECHKIVSRTVPQKVRTIDNPVLATLHGVNRLEKYMEKNVYTSQSFHAQ